MQQKTSPISCVTENFQKLMNTLSTWLSLKIVQLLLSLQQSFHLRSSGVQIVLHHKQDCNLKWKCTINYTHCLTVNEACPDRWKSNHTLLWHFGFLTLLYMTLRKSLLPFCGRLNAILGTNLDFFFIYYCHNSGHIMYEGEGYWEYVLVLMRWPPCVYFSLLRLAGVLESRCVTGQSITVLPKAHSCSVVPCWDKNEPAVQRGVWGVGPGASSLLYVQGEYKKKSENQWMLMDLFSHHLKVQLFILANVDHV